MASWEEFLVKQISGAKGWRQLIAYAWALFETWPYRMFSRAGRWAVCQQPELLVDLSTLGYLAFDNGRMSEHMDHGSLVVVVADALVIAQTVVVAPPLATELVVVILDELPLVLVLLPSEKMVASQV